ncbi:hypothetical protein PG993_015104 [Apiospora rasikravindrae]|uniref:BTB domain-containing protein n=1 Tax=Apiospora rasikravindrae TaxID=990691 RepID=A0ABR1RPQ3_9PEZI
MDGNEILHEIDRNGDFELVLHNPNAPFAVWVDDQDTVSPSKKKRKYSTAFGGDPSLFDSVDPGKSIEPQPQGLPIERTSAGAPTSQTCPNEPAVFNQGNQKGTVRFRLSSKHLAFASSYFDKAMRNLGKQQKGYTIHTYGWDPDALLILMNVIHGRHAEVPRKLELEKIAKIAVLVHFYSCHEVVEFCAERWTTNLKTTFPKEYGRSLVLWLAVGYVFCRKSIFQLMTMVAVKTSQGPLQALTLPIPLDVIGKQHQGFHINTQRLTSYPDTIEQRRQDALDKMITRLHDLTIYFSDKREKCSFECSSMLLGAITSQMQSKGLLNPSPVRPFSGYSISGVAATMRSFNSPKWADNDDIRPGVNPFGGIRAQPVSVHKCKLGTFIEAVIKDVEDGIEGMELPV